MINDNLGDAIYREHPEGSPERDAGHALSCLISDPQSRDPEQRATSARLVRMYLDGCNATVRLRIESALSKMGL